MPESYWLPHGRLGELVEALREGGHPCVGPTLRDGALMYGPLDGVAQLPRGVHDVQAPGSYRLRSDADGRYFAWANGPAALKPMTFVPREVLWRTERDADGRSRFRAEAKAPERVAVVGARPCDLAALELQDQHFICGPYPDPHYAARRSALFLVAVNCSHPAATCFCASTGDGPVARSGYDLLLDELDDGFLLRSGTAAGAQLLKDLHLEHADPEREEAARAQQKRAAEAQQRSLPGRDLRATLFGNLDHGRWDEVAGRCLSCGNCTSVCPTCFCHTELDVPALDGATSEHLREWDNCFTAGHSYLHGFLVREDTRARYRQWLTHKLGSWHDQYGRSGCVGCGRCITWCPVGIDITEEATAICAGGEQA